MKKINIKSAISNQNKSKAIWLVLCCIVLIIGIIGGVVSGRDNIRIEKVKAAQDGQKEAFSKAISDKEEYEPVRQNKDIGAVALLNVGTKGNSDIKAKDIHNIIVVVFAKNNRKQIIDVVGVQKETCIDRGKKNSLKTIKKSFDRNEPQKMYDALEKVIDYKVDSYIAYNNETLKSIMDMLYVVEISINREDAFGIDDLSRINKEQKKLVNQRFFSDKKKIVKYGMQPLNSIQAVAYANLYYNDWDCWQNDWRHMFLIRQFVLGMKDSNYSELLHMRRILLDGDCDIDDDLLPIMGAAIKNCKAVNLVRGPMIGKYVKHNNVYYLLVEKQLKNIKIIHRQYNHERGYTPSKTAREFAKHIKSVETYIADYAKKQAEKKKAKNSTNELEQDQSTTNGTDESKENKKKSKKNSRKKSSSGNKKSNGNKKNDNKSNGGSSKKADPTPTPTPQPAPEPTPEPTPDPADEPTDDGDTTDTQ